MFLFCSVDLQGRNEVSSSEPPNWDKEADRLRDAIQGLGTDEISIVRVLARLTNRQRRKLLRVYKERFNEVKRNQGFNIYAENVKQFWSTGKNEERGSSQGVGVEYVDISSVRLNALLSWFVVLAYSENSVEKEKKQTWRHSNKQKFVGCLPSVR